MTRNQLSSDRAFRATAACHANARSLTLFGWSLTLQRDPEWEYRRLATRLARPGPSPLAFAILVAALVIVTVAGMRWLDSPSHADDGQNGTGLSTQLALVDLRMKRR